MNPVFSCGMVVLEEEGEEEEGEERLLEKP